MGVAVADRSVPTTPRPAARRSSRRGAGRRAWRDYLVFLLFVGPNVLLIAAFVYRPLIVNIYYSTLDWTLGSPTARQIGFGNYREFFTTPAYRQVLWTTAIFTVATVGGAMILGLALATVLARPLWGRTVARATVFAPFVLSGVGIGLAWTFIFDPTTGVIGAILRALGSSSPQWFTNPHLSLTMLIIVYVWKNLGYCAVIYVAALQAMNKEVLEASSIDGAGAWRTFRSITLPLLSPTTFFLMLTSILNSLQAFDLIKIMTPLGNGTTTLMYATYLQAFGGYNRAGFSAAIATILFAILLVMTVIQLTLLERRVHYA